MRTYCSTNSAAEPRSSACVSASKRSKHGSSSENESKSARPGALGAVAVGREAGDVARIERLDLARVCGCVAAEQQRTSVLAAA